MHQILEEARNHLNISGQTIEEKTSWLDAPSECQLDAYRQLEAKLRSPKSSKSWKSFLFWKRPVSHYHESEGEFNTFFSTLEHPTLFEQNYSSQTKRKAKSSYSANLDSMNNHCRTRQQKVKSGPLYTDGLPCEPCNVKQGRTSHSGLLGTFLTLSSGYKDLTNIPPYALLHCPPPQSPLYCC